MDSAILADPTDNQRTRGRHVSETRATTTAETTPVFPPGRYGHRREGRRRPVVPLIIFAIVLAASLAVSVKLYEEFGQTGYQAQIVGWDPPTDTRILIHFTVTVPAGHAAKCSLEARDYGGNVLGDRDVVVRPTGDATTVDAKEAVTTTAKASAGYVLGCQAAD
jgi:Domain of unknown function (DUF4307)